MNAKPHIPIFKRPPNQFVRYVIEQFKDRSGHTGRVRNAIFLDKNGKDQSMVAQVIWD